MKKILTSIAAVAFVAMMITNVYARPVRPPPTVRPPCFPCDRCPGFTPGFWKHALTVRLGGPGNYQAFEGGALDGVKLTDAMIDGYIAAINAGLGGTTYTAEDFLAYMQEPGWSPNRTNTANWFNKVAGYGPF